MTLQTLRNALAKRRLDRRMSFVAMAAEMREVVGDEQALSAPTLFRFITDRHVPTETTQHALERYLTRTSRKGAA